MGQVNVPTDLERGELLAEKVSSWPLFVRILTNRTQPLLYVKYLIFVFYVEVNLNFLLDESIEFILPGYAVLEYQAIIKYQST